jgi:2-polyprenyl-6-methoxyphenol hydroxylase-like FAD-dependent oxidoreductase
MIAAYVLAGEFSRTASQPKEAFRRYEQRLQPFITDKQKAAVQFASSFAPKTRLGLFFRNQITNAFKLPFVAKLAMGPSLLDRIDLPDYPASGGLRS